MNRAPIFAAVKALRNGKGFTLPEVKALDAAIDETVASLFGHKPKLPDIAAAIPTTGRKVSERGIKLMHEFEGCRLTAYPDPGSVDGHPWTIGYGSTGEGIYKGVVWTQEEADERFARDLDRKYGKAVDELVGDSFTDQSMFDAMVSLCYNIGIGAFSKSTVLRKHKAGDHAGAAAAFGMWIKNDGKVMKGLVRRRAAEAALYLAEE